MARWARHWLDVARFAESHGFEQDYDRQYAYHFRDFVIKALNQDMPFRQFVRWQIAGDEIAPEEPLAMMATGFLGAGVFPTQITKNEVERTRYDALDDMASTTSVAFLGLTVGCARCHDHKFDPIPQADYYRMLSTFTTAVRSNIDLDLDPIATQRDKEKHQQKLAPLIAAVQLYEEQELPERFAAWEATQSEEPSAEDWVITPPASYRSEGGATLTPQADGSLLASGKNPDFDTYVVTFDTKLKQIHGLRIEALSHPSFVRGGPGRAGNGNIALTNLEVTAIPLGGEQKPEVLKLKNPKATFEQPGLAVANTIDTDKRSGWAVDPQFGKDHAAVYEIETPVAFEQGAQLTFTFEFKNNKQHNIGRLRIAVTAAPPPIEVKLGGLSQAIAEALGTPVEKRSADQRAALLTWFAPRDPGWAALQAAVTKEQQAAPKGHKTKVMVVSEGVKPIRHHTQGADFFAETHFLKRGDTDQKLTVAPQGFLQVLTGVEEGATHWLTTPPEGVKTSYRRQGLADWITDTDQGAGQLLARVIVNRLWQHHFGEGIVATPNDFGYQGERPSHPELLDHLARQLIADGWRLKPMHRRMMLTAAYMQSSEFDVADNKVDPENRWLWRFEPRRLEAEVIRDSMLAVSQTLDETMYGPGSLDQGHRRRSIYFKIKRSKLISTMQLFDSPEPLVSVGERPATTIAPQALHFMNSPQVRAYAQGLAKRASQGAADPAASVDQAYQLALGRSPTPAEKTDAAEFLASQTASYQQAKQQSPSQIALTDFCQVLMSLNEFVYVE